MKNEVKKNKNKGFSLVELIVVIAIMAVLMAILAPAMLRYVEKSRIQKDKTAVSEAANAAELALGDETVYTEAAKSTGDIVVTVKDDTAISCPTKAVQDEVQKTVGEKIQFKSKKYKGATATITLGTDTTGKKDGFIVKEIKIAPTSGTADIIS